ncbi:uncharacterized protein TRUGW13939_07538 [Talaromyces rugulosus]|uniref:3-hydroxyisobutyrate dehydrogenase n=1 Tax=Talaromyces rugulosus TaxID=121627 RepID=A0A7H8R6E0_TALRU|nr:uncharacterized protein TRUGW13939_07538 [Talaromyces rugulosus]QKX60393.1 hypothetical protein TRUGW13939_07538 [Talaromyces rugulosus]
MTVKTVGYIGLGNAGFYLAGAVAKAGFRLVVDDSDPQRVAQFVSNFPRSKAGRATKDGFKDVDVLVTMLPNGKVVRDVLLGDGGISKQLKNGTVVIDTSSSSPFDTRQCGAELRQHGLELIDAPVTQEQMHAIRYAAVTLMIGHDSDKGYKTALPVLQAMSQHVFVMGRLGAGHAMKTLNNYVSVGSILALCDALVAGQKFGLDPKTMIDVLNVGTGRNFSTANAFREEVLPRTFDSGYQLRLLVKDTKIAKEVIQASGLSTQLPDMAIECLSDALRRVRPTANHEECVKRWEEVAGVQLKQSDKPTDRPPNPRYFTSKL